VWTKLGDEFPDTTASLSDAAVRTHVEALCWSNRRLLDLVIPKSHLRRFAETTDPDAAASELVETGWWQDSGDTWFVGCRFAEWQVERSVIEYRRVLASERQRRHRLHKAGDHSLCTDSCSVTRDKTRDETRDPGRVGSGTGKDGLDEKKTHARKDEHDVCIACGKSTRFPIAGRCRDCHFAQRAAS
jgi:hypothetical protein